MIFGFLCIAVFFRIIYTLISRYFYAHKDTKTPLYVSLFVIGLNIFLAYNLAKPDAYGIVGLALAQSIVAATEVIILVIIMMRRDPKLFTDLFLQSLIKLLAVSGFTAVASFILVQILPLASTDTGFVLIAKLSIIAIFAFSVHILMSYVFGLPEAKTVVNKAKRIALGAIKAV